MKSLITETESYSDGCLPSGKQSENFQVLVLLRMRIATTVERTEEGKTCHKKTLLKLTKQKHDKKWQKRSARDETAGVGEKEEKEGQNLRNTLRLEELLSFVM